MRHEEYLQRRRELDERLRAAVEMLEAGHRAEVRELEALWAASGEAGAGEHGEPAARPPRRSPGELREAVRAALVQLPAELDKNEVCRALGQELDRASLHRVLLELVQEGVLEVKSLGIGREPTVYRQRSS